MTTELLRGTSCHRGVTSISGYLAAEQRDRTLPRTYFRPASWEGVPVDDPPDDLEGLEELMPDLEVLDEEGVE